MADDRGDMTPAGRTDRGHPQDRHGALPRSPEGLGGGPPHLPPPPRVILLLDLGSTVARIFLARIVPGVAFHVVQEECIQTGGRGGHQGTCPATATRGSLRAVRTILRDHRADQDPPVLVVTTAVSLNGTNGEDVLDALKRDEGVDVRVLSEHDEARLRATAARWSLAVDHAAIVHVSGHSLQIAGLHEVRVRPTARVPLGAVLAAQRFLKHGSPTPAELGVFRREIRRQVGDLLPTMRGNAGIVGLGGPVLALGRIHLRSVRDRRTCLHALRLRPADVTAIRERLEALLPPGRGGLNRAESQRTKALLAAAILLEHLMALGAYPTLTVCARGVGCGFLIAETFGGAARR